MADIHAVASLCDELTGDIPGKVQMRIKGFRKRWTPAFGFHYLTLKGGGANCAFPYELQVKWVESSRI